MTEYDIKKNLNALVRWKNSKLHIDGVYRLIGAVIRKGDTGFFYQAELQDIKQSKSICYCRLEEIKEMKKHGT